MIQYLPDHHRVCDTGNHLHSTPAFPAGFIAQLRDIGNYYKSWHQHLEAQLEPQIAQWGYSLLLDCHSFPDKPSRLEHDSGPERPDSCLVPERFAGDPRVPAIVLEINKRPYIQATDGLDPHFQPLAVRKPGYGNWKQGIQRLMRELAEKSVQQAGVRGRTIAV